MKREGKERKPRKDKRGIKEGIWVKGRIGRKRKTKQRSRGKGEWKEEKVDEK